MRVNYYSTIPPPVFPGTEAMMKEIDLLRTEFEGDFLNLYPFNRYIPGFPKVFTGMQHIRKLRSMDRNADIHHVFLHHLFPLPVLKVLKKPVVCSVITTASPLTGLLKDYPYHVVVNNDRDGEMLRTRGFDKFHVVVPGIDTAGITHNDFPFTGGDFVLFCGSAPWTHGDFHDKGFDLILELMNEMPDLRLVCLWRGVLYDEFIRKIENSSLQDRIEVINMRVDVNQVLSRVHAGVVLAESPGVAAAYPRSLIEMLVAGKPIISSGCLPIAGYIKRNECGCVVESFSLSHLKRCVGTMMVHYPDLAHNAQMRGKSDFTREKMVESYRTLYSAVIRH